LLGCALVETGGDWAIMQLGALVQGFAVSPAPGTAAGWESCRVCDLTEDSRTVVPGSMFVARAGGKADGKAFIGSALSAGATAILCDDASAAGMAHGVPVIVAADIAKVSAQIAERFYGLPSSRLAIMGVTGTNGKTTIAHLVWRLMNAAGSRCGMIGTVQVDDGTEVAPAMMTTPPSIEVSRTLGVMVESGCEAAAMEVSSHSLDQKRVEGLRFKVGVFTNLTGDHLDYHGSMDAYCAAKARLFKMLGEDAVAVVNETDRWAARVVEECCAPIVACRRIEADGVAPAGAKLARARELAWVRIARESMGGMRLEMVGPFGRIEADVPLIGAYNAMNVLQACVACHAMGMSAQQVREGLEAADAPPGRLERVSDVGSSVHVFVDYAHSDDALANVLHAVMDVMPGRAGAGGRVASAAGALVTGAAPGRLWAVFGCGGDRDRMKRPRMGCVAAAVADRVVVTSDNPRRERPSDIIDQILSGVAPEHRHKVEVQADRARAIRHAIESATPGDVVVIAGKGHETEQILPDGQGGTIRTHFDDCEVARTILLERGEMGAAVSRTNGRTPGRAWGRGRNGSEGR
jgi:UDP-N-acetylmuramyl-tripeptide synthetase